jgi:phosphoglycerate dehydrogenase-like enzyme
MEANTRNLLEMVFVKTKVVVQFPIAHEALALIQEVAEVEVMSVRSANRSDQSLVAAVSNAQAFIGNPNINEEFLRQAPKLKILAHYGVGYQDRFDIEACTRRKVYVTYTPGALSDAVAELTLGLILCCARQIPLADVYVRSDSWRSGEMWPLGVGLEGKTLGILGLGRIGYEVAKRARAFGMNIIYNDVVRNTKGEAEGLARYVGFEEVLTTSDFLTIHIPQTPENAKKIGEKELKLMKNTAYLINTSRGGIIDEAALCTALSKKQIAGAGLDVFAVEPLPKESPLARMRNVVLTPHVGSATIEARKKMALMNATDVIRVLKGEAPLNIVPEQKGKFT